MNATTPICLRMVPFDLDGVWMRVQPGRGPYSVQMGYTVTELVATGDIEWNGDLGAEVYVPVGKLGEWRRRRAIDVG